MEDLYESTVVYQTATMILSKLERHFCYRLKWLNLNLTLLNFMSEHLAHISCRTSYRWVIIYKRIVCLRGCVLFAYEQDTCSIILTVTRIVQGRTVSDHRHAVKCAKHDCTSRKRRKRWLLCSLIGSDRTIGLLFRETSSDLVSHLTYYQPFQIHFLLQMCNNRLSFFATDWLFHNLRLSLVASLRINIFNLHGTSCGPSATYRLSW